MEILHQYNELIQFMNIFVDGTNYSVTSNTNLSQTFFLTNKMSFLVQHPFSVNSLLNFWRGSGWECLLNLWTNCKLKSSIDGKSKEKISVMFYWIHSRVWIRMLSFKCKYIKLYWKIKEILVLFNWRVCQEFAKCSNS